MTDPRLTFDVEWTPDPYHTSWISVRGDFKMDDKSFLQQLQMIITYICSFELEHTNEIPVYQIVGPFRYTFKHNQTQFSRSLHCLLKIRIARFQVKDLRKKIQLYYHRKESLVKNEITTPKEEKTIKREREHNRKLFQLISPLRIHWVRSLFDTN